MQEVSMKENTHGRSDIMWLQTCQQDALFRSQKAAHVLLVFSSGFIIALLLALVMASLQKTR
jgi:hypothetical protein